MRVSIVKWAAFGLVIPLIPLIFGYLVADVTQAPASVLSSISRGQLALLATALAARGMSELVATRRQTPALSTALGGISIAVILLSALFYGRFAELTSPDSVSIAKYSVWMYVFAMATSLGCVVLAAEDKA